MSVRELFVARFDEQTAVAIEEASLGHISHEQTHVKDKWGSEAFRYHFMNAIAHQCMTKYAVYHGVDKYSADEYREWSVAHAQIPEHDGDMPDYIGIMAGMYEGWYPEGGDTEWHRKIELFTGLRKGMPDLGALNHHVYDELVTSIKNLVEQVDTADE